MTHIERGIIPASGISFGAELAAFSHERSLGLLKVGRGDGLRSSSILRRDRSGAVAECSLDVGLPG
jgi:hypothetical protein